MQDGWLMAPDVIGMNELLGKQSAVDGRGGLRLGLIDGVQFRPTRPVPHEDGHVSEIARADWEIMAQPIVQVHMTTTLPGRVRAWGLHRNTTDRLFVVCGLVQIVVFDGRTGSSTFGKFNEITVSDKNPGLLTIAPLLYHGWKNIGTSDAVIVNMPDRMYDYDAPDALELPWQTDAARRLISYRW
jgi:dTDP-4-dehydrorhamnose 3,5-epimerase